MLKRDQLRLMISHDESIFTHETEGMNGGESMEAWMHRSKVEMRRSGLAMVYERCSQVKLGQHLRKKAR